MVQVMGVSVHSWTTSKKRLSQQIDRTTTLRYMKVSVNPSTPISSISYQDRISPYHIKTISNWKVMRIRIIIWSNIKFWETNVLRIVWQRVRRITSEILEVKGLNNTSLNSVCSHTLFGWLQKSLQSENFLFWPGWLPDYHYQSHDYSNS